MPTRSECARRHCACGGSTPAGGRSWTGTPPASDAPTSSGPTALACWLAGVGVGLLTNPPRRPQANGVIERYQGVGKSWGEPPSCRSASELQRRLDELDRWQRDLYPTTEGRPRSEVYAGLKHSGRRYTRAREETMWDLGRAWAWVGSHLVGRQVDSQGKVSLYNRPYTVGLKWRGRK